MVLWGAWVWAVIRVKVIHCELTPNDLVVSDFRFVPLCLKFFEFLENEYLNYIHGIYLATRQLYQPPSPIPCST